MVVPMIMTTLLLVMIKGGESKRDSKILGSSVIVSMLGVAMAIIVAMTLIPLIQLAANSLPGLGGERVSAEASNI
jgi:Na+/H+-dicarboxylate symporter